MILTTNGACIFVGLWLTKQEDRMRSVRELLDTFLSLGLAGTVARLESMQELL